ncbi:MAG: hypothetical protein Tsb0020_55110 [Haliangiales bacterium]
MSFWKRLFSADYRAAVSAEAAGQLEQAAEHFVLAGEPVEAARIHLARAERADNRSTEIDALRDALHWVGADEALTKRIKSALGRALLSRARDEGVATARDHRRVREAAELLLAGGDYATAGEALESVGDASGAAKAYRLGGLVEQMELLMSDEVAERERARQERESFADYELHMRLGDREAAREALRRCLDSAANKAEYRHLYDQLESRIIGGGRVVLRRRGQPAIVVVGVEAVVLGRDPLCELPLRTGGVSRRHAVIAVAGPDESPRFSLRDLGSRNGTLIGGLPIEGRVPLTGRGRFELGDQCAVDFVEQGAPAALSLRVERGLDRDLRLLVVGSGERLGLDEVAALPVEIEFRGGRPYLSARDASVALLLDGDPIAAGSIQLIRGDVLTVDGVEVEVE